MLLRPQLGVGEPLLFSLPTTTLTPFSPDGERLVCGDIVLFVKDVLFNSSAYILNL